MPKAITSYVRFVDAVNRRVGRLTMLLVFVMIGVLVYAAISRTLFDTPLIWTVEVAQMTMAAYYLLGGAYSLQLDSHVRMDLLYGRWSPRGKAVADVITGCCVIVYMIVLLYGAISSTQYALEYGQKNFSAWAPPLAPIKIVMTIGVVLMFMQVLARFFRDIAIARGKPIA